MNQATTRFNSTTHPIHPLDSTQLATCQSTYATCRNIVNHKNSYAIKDQTCTTRVESPNERHHIPPNKHDESPHLGAWYSRMEGSSHAWGQVYGGFSFHSTFTRLFFTPISILTLILFELGPTASNTLKS